MTAQVEFFCSPAEERDVLRYLTKAPNTRVFDVRGGSLTPCESFSAEDLPPWPEAVHVYLWQPTHGSLVWHKSPPAISGESHRSFVMNLFAREAWDARRLGVGDQLLNADLSPIVCYRRGLMRDGRVGPNLILAPPSSLLRAGREYERYVQRSLRGSIVHDWRNQSVTIPNPAKLVNTIYAFPDVEQRLKEPDHEFGIFVQ
jgi:hypothetical protein